ncbi:MAG: M20/M25/M40 family metallo-hydrolase [Pseudomonadota bacterium]
MKNTGALSGPCAGLLLLLNTFAISACSQSTTANDETLLDNAEPARIKAHVSFLADDLLEGRKPGEPGYDLAAIYVRSQLEQTGAAPLFGAEDFYHPVNLKRSERRSQEKIKIGSCKLSPDDPSLVFGPALNSSGKQAVSAEAVFVGYGIDAPDYGIDDFADIDVAGKVAVFLNGFPDALPGEVGAHYMLAKPQTAREHGAIGTIEVETRHSERRRPWTLIRQTFHGPVINLSDPPAQISPLGNRADIRTYGEASHCLFENSPQRLNHVLALVDETDGSPGSFDLHTQVQFTRSNTDYQFTSPNVVASITGRKKSDDVGAVLLLAHLDHIGVDPQKAREGDGIYNGALDNAMGVSVLLEVARTLKQQEDALHRPVIFAFLTAEESGMIGSAKLAEELTRDYPGGIAAVINVDMPVVLHELKDVVAIGASHSTLGHLVERAAATQELTHSPDPAPQEGRFTRSDHYRFVQYGVPAVSIAVGKMGDADGLGLAFGKSGYHQPTDDLSLPIDWQAAADLTDFVTRLTWLVASSREAPIWYEGSIFGDTFAPSAPKAKTGDEM